MRNILRVSFLACIVALVMYAAGQVFLQTKGRIFLTEKISEALKRHVTIRDVHWQLPLTLRLRGVSLDGEYFAREIQARLGLPFFSKDEIHVVTLHFISPLFHIRRTKQGSFELSGFSLNSKKTDNEEPSAPVQEPPQLLEKESAEKEQGKAQSRGENLFGPRVKVGRLAVRSGQIDIADAVSEKPFQVVLQNVWLSAGPLEYPLDTDVHTIFSVKALLDASKVSSLSDLGINASGWFNIKRRDMAADVAMLKSGDDLGLTARVVSQNNAMHVEGSVNLDDLNALIDQVPDDEVSPFESLFWGGLSSSGLKMVVNFAFDTRMNDMRVDEVALNGGVGFISSGTSDQEESEISVEEKLNEMGKHFEAFGKKIYEEVIRQRP